MKQPLTFVAAVFAAFSAPADTPTGQSGQAAAAMTGARCGGTTAKSTRLSREVAGAGSSTPFPFLPGLNGAA